MLKFYKHLNTLVFVKKINIGDRWTNKKNWWNDTDRAELLFSERHLPKWQFAYHQFHMNWSGTDPVSLRWESGA